MKVYNELRDMEIAIGDTLPFDISVDVTDGTSLDGSSMKLMIASEADASYPIISKDCTVDVENDTLFHVTLTTEDTLKLSEKTYIMYFVLVDSEDNEYWKLACSIYAHTAPRGDST